MTTKYYDYFIEHTSEEFENECNKCAWCKWFFLIRHTSFVRINFFTKYHI